MHVEQQLLSRIIRTGQLAEVQDWGILDEDFTTTEGKGIYQHLQGYWQSVETSGAVQGPHSFLNLYPGFQFCDDDSMTLPALCTEVRRNYVRLATNALMVEAQDQLQRDPMSALNFLSEGVSRYMSLGMKQVDERISNGASDLRHRYERAESGIGTCALKWPWPPLNEATMGIQEDDYIVIYGRPKSKKSFVLGSVIADAYDQRKCALVYTKEMPAWQLNRRVAAAIGRLPFDGVRLGRLPPDLRRLYFDILEELDEASRASFGRRDIITVSGKDAPAGQDSISWLRGKVNKYKPDIIFIDGLYLMASDRKVGKDEERVRMISRAARQLVLDTKTPLVATMQANRAAAKHANAELDEIAYSDAIGQDATCAMRVVNENNSPATVVLKIGGSREFSLDGFRIGGEPYANMGFKEMLGKRELEKAIRKDTDEAAPPNPQIHQPVTRTPSNGSPKSNKGLLNDQFKSNGMA